MQPALKPIQPVPATDRHARMRVGTAVAVYVWQYPLRLFHWGMVMSLVALSITGYYIHNPYIIAQPKTPFLMGWVRFVHECFGFTLIALFVLRMYLLFAGNRWENWKYIVPLRKKQWLEMFQVMRFYAFLRPTPVSKVGHNAAAAASYCGIYGLLAIETITGLVMYNMLAHNPVLTFFLGWIPRTINIMNLRLIHFALMYVFIAFGVLHVHLCLIVSSAEKRGLLDSIFTGYKIVPVDELDEDDREAIVAAKGKRVE